MKFSVDMDEVIPPQTGLRYENDYTFYNHNVAGNQPMK